MKLNNKKEKKEMSDEDKRYIWLVIFVIIAIYA